MFAKPWTKIIIGLFLLHLLLPLAAGKVEVSVEPQPVRVGEAACLVIRSTDGTRNRPIGDYPKVSGLSWLGGAMQSSQTHIINGRRSSVFELRIPFAVAKPGSYTIPAIILTHSKEPTKKITFEAVPARYQTTSQNRRRPAASRLSRDDADAGLTPDQIMFMETEVPGRRPFYYLGEEIPLDVNIYVLEGVQPRLTWPTITFGEKSSAVFRDYKQSNPENPNFAGMTQHRVERNGRDYIRCSFRTALRPITAGKLEINVRENAAIIVRDTRRRTSDDIFDDFFGESFFSRGRQVDRNMNNGPLVLEIRNLPAIPDGARFTGLVGHWDSLVTLSPPPYKVGEPITMKVEFQGNGSTDTLRTWPLDLKGFRVYPPEVERNAGGAEIRYVLIPTEPADGKTENISFGPYAVFNKGTYQTKTFKRAIAIEKGSAVIPGNAGTYTVASPSPSAAAETKTDAPKRKAEDILYLKKNEGRTVPLPPEVNIAGGIIVIAAGIVFLILASIMRGIRRAREKDPDYQRKAAAHSRKPALLARLKQLPPEEIPAACGADIASYLADAKGLPPGADLADCAAAVKEQSPELAGVLEEISQAAWMPSMKSKFTPAFRDALVKALRKIAVILLLCLPGMMFAAETRPASSDEAMNAYDTGKFSEAEKYYRSRLNPAEPSANLLYNIGNCLFQQGYFPQAMVCFERAAKLSPRDPDILENLNLTRRKQLLPEKYKVESPSDILPYLRDSLRPDEWLFLVCCGVSLLFFAAGTALLAGFGRTFRILLIGGIVLIAVPGIAYLVQQRTSYNPDFAVVTARTLPVRSLPSDQAGKTEMTLRSGEEVTVVERRMDWVRIRSGTAEGWVHAKDITSLWSPKSAGDI